MLHQAAAAAEGCLLQAACLLHVILQGQRSTCRCKKLLPDDAVQGGGDTEVAHLLKVLQGEA